MKTFYILIDSSTVPEKGKKSKYGRSAAFWSAFWDSINSAPCCYGMIVRDKEGPNKIFYDGVISSLIGCEKYCQWDIDIIVKGDSDLIIKQLSEVWQANDLKEYFSRVKDLEKKFKRKVKYEYIGETDPIYKKVDALAKRARGKTLF